MSITPAAVVLKANKSPGWEVSTNILDCESLEGEAGERGALFRAIKEILTISRGFRYLEGHPVKN